MNQNVKFAQTNSRKKPRLTCQGRHEHDPAAGLPEQRQEGLGDADGAQGVDFVDAAVLGDGAPLDLREGRDAGVVHDGPQVCGRRRSWLKGAEGDGG